MERMRRVASGRYRNSTGFIEEYLPNGQILFRLQGTNTIVTFPKNHLERLSKVCTTCHHKFTVDQLHFSEDLPFCEECFRAVSFVCHHCHGRFANELVKVVGNKKYCPDCFNEEFFVCEHCDETFSRDEEYGDVGEETWCQTCIEQNSISCNNCGERVNEREIRTGADDEDYCYDCWEQRFARCPECEEVFWQENLYNGYCEDCQPEQQVINDYTFSPRLQFKKMPHENTLYLGLELEVENNSSYSDTEKAEDFIDYLGTLKMKNDFFLKHDGSLDTGFEIVSHPFTLQYSHKNYQWKNALKWLEDNKFSSHDNGRCGMHVHLNKDFFSKTDLMKLRLFFAKNKPSIRSLSNRRGVGERYCAYENFENINVKRILKGINPEGRYWALNLNTQKPTVEIRIFRGTLNYKRFIANLQFCDAVCHYVKLIGLTHLVKGSDTWGAFKTWAKSTNRYKEFLNLCIKNNY